MSYARRVTRQTRLTERQHLYKSLYKPQNNIYGHNDIVDEAFKKNIEELVNRHKESQVITENIKKDINSGDMQCSCLTCRNASFDGLTCYYAALHPSDKRFKSSAGIPAGQAILNCYGYVERQEFTKNRI